MNRRIKYITVILIFAVVAYGCGNTPSDKIIIGSKKFTESVILGELVKQIAENSGEDAGYLQELGGTRILWNALLQGEIDIYPEYTGTILNEILARENIPDLDSLNKYLRSKGIRMSRPLGFNNTYALGMLKARARELGIKRISDLSARPELKIAFTNEFLDRSDGWPGLRETYNLNGADVTGIDHDLAYKALASGAADVIDLYSTDAEIEYYSIQTLEDDRNYFPDYFAVYLYREELEEKSEFLTELRKLENNISASEMVTMNSAAKIQGSPESAVVSEFLAAKFGTLINDSERGIIRRFLNNSREHLKLVLISLLMAIFTAIPLGIAGQKNRKLGGFILGTVGIIQTIPSLALLVFMIPLLGIGAVPAIAALFLYSLLPIVRGTYTGIDTINREIIDSAKVLGLSKKFILWKIEMPLASKSILSGIKTSAVINVGTATLGALIGAGGYGQPILTGIRLDSVPLILEGAVPAAALAVLVQLLFDLSERWFVPKGLRN